MFGPFSAVCVDFNTSGITLLMFYRLFSPTNFDTDEFLSEAEISLVPYRYRPCFLEGVCVAISGILGLAMKSPSEMSLARKLGGAIGSFLAFLLNKSCSRAAWAISLGSASLSSSLMDSCRLPSPSTMFIIASIPAVFSTSLTSSAPPTRKNSLLLSYACSV